MEHIKIQITTSSGTRTMFVPQSNDWWSFLQVLPRICPNVAPLEGASVTSLPKGIRLYWIDEDSDKIDIVDDDSYHYFIALAKPAKKKLYVEVEESKTPESLRSAPSPRSEAGTTQGTARAPELQVHDNVECDGCDKSPIIGFRYKCVQCVDYDLCADCEAKGMHSEHVMFRLPTSIESVSFDRHTWKKMKRGCPMRSENDEGTSRRHGHGHGHGHGHKHRPNIFSNLYTMMHDMAEGTEGPAQDDPESPAAGCERRKRKEERKPRKCHQRDVPIIPIDPTYVKAGVQILNNLNEMFVNMLSPTVVPDTNVPTANRETAGPSGEGTTAKPQEKKSDAPKENGAAPATSSGENAKSSTRKEVPTTDAPSAPMDQDLYICSSESSDSEPEEVDMDPKSGEQNKTGQPEPATAKQPQQPEPPIVYHKNPAINRAVHAMMAMGFSNEGNWLSQLLESVNGNISQALDLLKPVK